MMRIEPFMQLSPNFALPEFTRSEMARRNQVYNLPRDVSEIANLKALCDRVLEPVRALFGRPVIITSGYRSAALNRLVGGAADSQHLYGEAADFIVAGLRTFDVALTLANHPDLPFDQLIYETRLRADGRANHWVHISHRRLGPNRAEVLSVHSGPDGRRTLPGVQAHELAEV